MVAKSAGLRLLGENVEGAGHRRRALLRKVFFKSLVLHERTGRGLTFLNFMAF
jgi:hypothetical protein